MNLKAIEQRASILAKNNGNILDCIDKKLLPRNVDVTLSEGIILGLLKQNVKKYFAIFGHGSTDFAEILRIYEKFGVTKTFNFEGSMLPGVERYFRAFGGKQVPYFCLSKTNHPLLKLLGK